MKFASVITILHALTVAAFAIDPKPSAAEAIALHPLLGKDAAAYLKALNVQLDVTIRKEPPLVTRTGKVPNFGHITLNVPGTLDPDETASVKGITVFFADDTATTWQLAFAKAGIPIELAKEEKTGEGELRVIFTAHNGKKWAAFFSPPLTREQAERSGRNPHPVLDLTELKGNK